MFCSKKKQRNTTNLEPREFFMLQKKIKLQETFIFICWVQKASYVDLCRYARAPTRESIVWAAALLTNSEWMEPNSSVLIRCTLMAKRSSLSSLQFVSSDRRVCSLNKCSQSLVDSAAQLFLLFFWHPISICTYSLVHIEERRDFLTHMKYLSHEHERESRAFNFMPNVSLGFSDIKNDISIESLSFSRFFLFFAYSKVMLQSAVGASDFKFLTEKKLLHFVSTTVERWNLKSPRLSLSLSHTVQKHIHANL